MSLLLGSVLRWIYSHVRARHSGAYLHDLRLLDPPCTYSPTLNVTLPAGASSAFLRDHPEPGHARSGLSHDVLPPLRPYTWMPAARAELPEDLHTTNPALSAPPSLPSLLVAVVSMSRRYRG